MNRPQIFLKAKQGTKWAKKGPNRVELMHPQQKGFCLLLLILLLLVINLSSKPETNSS